jgi:hypothetical protein
MFILLEKPKNLGKISYIRLINVIHNETACADPMDKHTYLTTSTQSGE